jgi:hypothetical protein
MHFTVEVVVHHVGENTDSRGQKNRVVTDMLRITTRADTRMQAIGKAIRLLDCERNDTLLEDK